MSEKLNSRGMVGWYLFDWANSAFPTLIITFVYATFFTEHIAADRIEGSALWGYAVGIAGLLVVLIGPVLGAIADVTGHRKRWLMTFVIVEIFASAMLWGVKADPHYTYYALLFVILGDAAMEICSVFYNSMLIDLISEDQIGKASGLGWGISYLGGLCSLSVLWFIIFSPQIDLFNLPADELIHLTGPFVAAWLFVFSIPLFLFTPEKVLKSTHAIRTGVGNLIKTFKSVMHYKNSFRFMIA